jgi:hypothetical protein
VDDQGGVLCHITLLNKVDESTTGR